MFSFEPDPTELVASTTHGHRQIEKVFVTENTSPMLNEVFAHRLGLVPLAVDWKVLEENRNGEVETASNVVKFTLDVTGEAGESFTRVTSGDLKWRPMLRQPVEFETAPPRLVRVCARIVQSTAWSQRGSHCAGLSTTTFCCASSGKANGWPQSAGLSGVPGPRTPNGPPSPSRLTGWCRTSS